MTYLSLWIKICFVSYKDHGELIPVFHSKNLSLEFVDFFKTVKIIIIVFTFNAKSHSWGQPYCVTTFEQASDTL